MVESVPSGLILYLVSSLVKCVSPRRRMQVRNELLFHCNNYQLTFWTVLCYYDKRSSFCKREMKHEKHGTMKMIMHH